MAKRSLPAEPWQDRGPDRSPTVEQLSSGSSIRSDLAVAAMPAVGSCNRECFGLFDLLLVFWLDEP